MTTVPREKGSCCGGGQEQLQPGLGMVPMGPHSLALSPVSWGRSLAKWFGAVPAALEGACLGVLSLHWPHCQARLVPRQLAGTFQASAPSTVSCWNHPCPGGVSWLLQGLSWEQAGSTSHGLNALLEPGIPGQRSLLCHPQLAPPLQQSCPKGTLGHRCCMEGAGAGVVWAPPCPALQLRPAWGQTAQAQLRVLYKNVLKKLFTISTPSVDELRRRDGQGRALLAQQTLGQGSQTGSRCAAGAASLPRGSPAAARAEHPPPGSLQPAPRVALAQRRTGVPVSAHLLCPPQALRCRHLLGWGSGSPVEPSGARAQAQGMAGTSPCCCHVSSWAQSVPAGTMWRR